MPNSLPTCTANFSKAAATHAADRRSATRIPTILQPSFPGAAAHLAYELLQSGVLGFGPVYLLISLRDSPAGNHEIDSSQPLEMLPLLIVQTHFI